MANRKRNIQMKFYVTEEEMRSSGKRLSLLRIIRKLRRRRSKSFGSKMGRL